MTPWLLLLFAAPPEAALHERLRALCAELSPTLVVEVEQAPSVEAFVAATGLPRFVAAGARGATIWLQPSAVLDRLPELDGVLRHECAHAYLRAERVPPLALALEEAVALELSGQAAKLPPATPAESEEERRALSASLARPRDRARYEADLARAASTYGALVRAWRREGTLLTRLRELGRRSGSGR